jgi:predicted DNA-binding protein (UPF0251 family)
MRRIAGVPEVTLFKPSGVPASVIEHVILNFDEVEALRLADLDGLYQEQAAERMSISRPTFARIIERARRKVADALVNGKAIRMEGGTVAKQGVDMPGRAVTGQVITHSHGKEMGQRRNQCGCGMRRRSLCSITELNVDSDNQQASAGRESS